MSRLKTIPVSQRKSLSALALMALKHCVPCRTTSRDLQMKETLMYAKVLYEDNYCRISNGTLRIKNYYAPFGNRRQVFIREITTVYYDQQQRSYGCPWGLALSNNVWWALQCGRTCSASRSKHNVVIQLNQSTLKGFSVERVAEFMAALREFASDDLRYINYIPDYGDLH